MNEIRQNCDADVKIYLVGNKSDAENRAVSADKALAFAKKEGIHQAFEASAKTGENVREMFMLAAKDLYLQEIAAL